MPSSKQKGGGNRNSGGGTAAVSIPNAGAVNSSAAAAGGEGEGASSFSSFSDKLAFMKGFLSAEVLRVVFVQMSTAVLLGYVIGYVGVYNTLNSINVDCTQYTTEEACLSPDFTVCGWRHNASIVGGGVCYFTDVNCAELSEPMCRNSDDKCKYNYDDDMCEHLLGFSALYSGIFSGAMTVGAFIGSVVGGIIVGLLGRRSTLLTSALINIVGTILVHVSRRVDEYWVLTVGRLVLGVGTGMGCIAAPMYTEEMTPEAYRPPVGAMFQVFCTLGIALAAAMGLIVEPRDFAGKQNTELRIQMLNMVQSLLCVFSLTVSIFIPESRTFLKIKADRKKDAPAAAAESPQQQQPSPTASTQRPAAASNQEEAGDSFSTFASTSSPAEGGARNNGSISLGSVSAVSPFDAANRSEPPATSAPALQPPTADAIKVYPFSQMILPLFTAFILCLAQQLTGINAIMNYAPTITTSMGLSALLGNFVIMIWNFVTTLISIPASKYFSLRQMFITGVLIASSAMLIAGVPMYPGVYSNDTGREGFAGLGIFLFILAFEVGMGPAFYVLSQALFPTSFRPKGSAFTMAVQYLFNVVINVFFPIAVESFSGGPSGNQDKGMAIVFFFFAGCGALSFVLLLMFLFPFKEDKSAAGEQRPPVAPAAELA